MKLMIASDIHGSAYYCKKMLDAYYTENPDSLLLLGDILYHGPRNDLPHGYAPKEVIAMLNPLSDKIICVRGNCDAEVDQMVLDFSVSEPYKILIADGHTLFATHGHLYNQNTPPDLRSGYVLLNGHTHIPACEKHEGFTYINTGSVSIPKEQSPHSYVIYDKDCFEWKTLDRETYMRSEM